MPIGRAIIRNKKRPIKKKAPLRRGKTYAVVAAISYVRLLLYTSLARGANKSSEQTIVAKTAFVRFFFARESATKCTPYLVFVLG